MPPAARVPTPAPTPILSPWQVLPACGPLTRQLHPHARPACSQVRFSPLPATARSRLPVPASLARSPAGPSQPFRGFPAPPVRPHPALRCAHPSQLPDAPAARSGRPLPAPRVGRRADWTPIGALTSCFLLTHRGQHRALNNTDRRGNPLIWLDCGGQQSVLDNKPGCTRWRARSGSRHGRRERDLAGGVGAARSVSIAVSMTFPMRSAAASTSRSLTWA